MAENSKIEWCNHTFNPWIGCTKVSDGCKHCYAEAMMDKRYGRVKWGPSGVRVRTSAANWKKPLKWNRQAKKEGVRYRVFCASLADVFEDKPDQPELYEWRQELFGLIGDTPYLDWLLLTKRPENVERMIACALHGTRLSLEDDFPNVWIGTSVENQEQADKRIPELLQIPARVRFLSMEPLLGAVDLTCFMNDTLDPEQSYGYVNSLIGFTFDTEGFGNRLSMGAVDWVIVGGESGSNARPMRPDWVCSIRDQCVETGVPFLFKQWGEWIPYDAKDHEDWALTHDDISQWRWLTVDGREGPVWRKDIITTMIKIGKKKAGRLLDGRSWDQFPEISK